MTIQDRIENYLNEDDEDILEHDGELYDDSNVMDRSFSNCRRTCSRRR